MHDDPLLVWLFLLAPISETYSLLLGLIVNGSWAWQELLIPPELDRLTIAFLSAIIHCLAQVLVEFTSDLFQVDHFESLVCGEAWS